MATYEKDRFSEQVTSAFSTEQEEAKTLWVPLKQQFDEEGPEAAREYLEAQRQQLADHVKKQLDHIKERVDG